MGTSNNPRKRKYPRMIGVEGVGILKERTGIGSNKWEVEIKTPTTKSMPRAKIPAKNGFKREKSRKMYPKAIINPTRGIAARLSTREEKAIRLKADAIKGKTPNWAVMLTAKISLILRGSRGKNLINFAKKRMMDRVAIKVS